MHNEVQPHAAALVGASNLNKINAGQEGWRIDSQEVACFQRRYSGFSLVTGNTF
jgi:hypothetical protein